MTEFFALALLVVVLVQAVKSYRRLAALNASKEALQEAQIALDAATDRAERLDRELETYRPIKDVQRHVDQAQQQVQSAMREAAEIISQARLDGRKIQADARDKALRIEEKKAGVLEQANSQASRIVADAHARAEEIAGSAYRALEQAEALEATATAMRNVIEGYGDRYLKPTYSLLDELAEKFGFDDAGKQLQLARERVALMIEAGRAAECDYVEQDRKTRAIRFVIDAFNGKVESILTRVRTDNYGTLERQVNDAWALVNAGGLAFRRARITTEYLQARLDELQCACAVMLVREREREEQRAIREQMREEERARREIERALKDAAKEEAMLERAMEKVRQQVARASDEQKAQFEAELAALQIRLQEAEEKNQRAMSMAQQTRAGHVYIISNIGSFGEHVYKVGMTRRLEPLDRVRELGDASVPFSFDVHAMIWCDDAPALEHALHMEFVQAQVNKLNPRKEFFRVGLSQLREAIERRGIEASWTMSAAAAEYRESKAIEQQIQASEPARIEWERKQAEFQPEQELAMEDVSEA